MSVERELAILEAENLALRLRVRELEAQTDSPEGVPMPPANLAKLIALYWRLFRQGRPYAVACDFGHAGPVANESAAAKAQSRDRGEPVTSSLHMFRELSGLAHAHVLAVYNAKGRAA